ncbi:hypothetical protein IOK49_05325 [Fervidicoccus fontis]|jgi:tRNA wybutosine-synthesizing protein 3|uniref:tRNA(Phe) 7-((3-amino-3-carboxypropyl)-4-demethylwyosine(37)-N(4))-methyltransferase n=2 Tax=Fervidicoccus fontis TaxID=683846 RepID=I0A1U5_FERFK|nr:hypothetical protein [Fervidicoccus fontis]AFH42952.1 hypothetical protein FFONT_0964 [Fervidicoccus fontis Kam940]MBE9391492.1 hypothetical protein [Fervidicoccus fontis]PMB77161.1 MAG: hypothetical protein C0177_04075 [Fervidicoccus fontis]HEW63488.1 hypothetical protein [Fervidicoccus fontis]
MLVADVNVWKNKKTMFIKRIESDREIGYLDPGIDETLSLINKREKSYTTSSCSGRISIVDTDYLWKRNELPLIFKKHSEVSSEELISIFKKEPMNTFWLIVSGPILHVRTLDIEEALFILNAGREAGFKHSGIMSYSEDGYLVELISGTQFNFPIKNKNGYLINIEKIDYIAKLANSALVDGRRKLEKLNQFLKEKENEIR